MSFRRVHIGCLADSDSTRGGSRPAAQADNTQRGSPSNTSGRPPQGLTSCRASASLGSSPRSDPRTSSPRSGQKQPPMVHPSPAAGSVRLLGTRCPVEDVATASRIPVETMPRLRAVSLSPRSVSKRLPGQHSTRRLRMNTQPSATSTIFSDPRRRVGAYHGAGREHESNRRGCARWGGRHADRP